MVTFNNGIEMKSLEFSSKSWHFKVADKFGGYNVYRQDFCHYVRSVIWGLLVLMFFGALGGALTYCFGDWLAWFAVGIVHSFTEPGVGALIFNGLLATAGIIALCFGFIGGCVWISEKRRDARWKAQFDPNHVEPPPSFLKHAYVTLKEKTCFKLTIKD